MNICLFSKSEIDKPLHQNDERAIHIRKVLHKKEGESFDAGIINGMAGIATITKISETGEIYFSFTETKNGKEERKIEFQSSGERNGIRPNQR